MTEKSEGMFVPAWLLESWEIGQKSRGSDPETDRLNLMADISYMQRQMIDDSSVGGSPDNHPFMRRWIYLSKLARLGWLEVQRAQAQGETDRTQDSDQPS